MKMYNDCLPCIARGALDAAKLATKDELCQTTIVKKVLKELLVFDLNSPPPLMARFIQRTVKDVTGVLDPYKELKKVYNDFALKLYPELKSGKANSNDRFETAVRLSIAGNIIDFGTHNTVGKQKVLQTIDQSLAQRVHGDIRSFEQAVTKANKILWLGDNSGEIVFDKLLMEEIGHHKITYAVRGGYALNDATLEDLDYTGISKIVNVISNGADIPGTILEECSREFKELYTEADLILSKGQGNFETLTHGDERIYFLFKAKCSVVARYSGCENDDMVVKNI
ncbi:MAG: DUF89 family protein [Desulfobacteraceae bacterium]|nr:DUF89 family protein [Desulfobacteraceae bacterium]